MMKLACSVVIATTFIGLRTGPSAESADPSSLPSMLDAFLAEEVRPTASERAALLSGEPLVRLLDADQAKEIAVFGAIWVNAPSTLILMPLRPVCIVASRRHNP